MEISKKSVLLVYEALIPSVRLCGYLQLSYLKAANAIDFCAKKFSDIKKNDILKTDIVVFVRNDSLQDVWLAKKCRKAGKYLIYVLDDDLLNVPDYISSAQHYGSRRIRRQMLQIMSMCDCLASPSEKLLRKYGYLFPHFFQIIEPAEVQMKGKKKSAMDGRIRIGFAGSTDRGNDLDQILGGAIATIMQKYHERVSVEMFGPETILARHLGLTSYPYLNSYEEYQQQMRKLSWDIGLAPMPHSDFHRCKYYNKLIEYASFGIAGVYSDELPYAGSVEDGITGVLCENTQDAWVAAISHLIEDEILRKSIQENCLQMVREEYSVEKAAEEWLEQIHSCTGEANQAKELRFFAIEKNVVRWRNFYDRICRAVQRRLLH